MYYTPTYALWINQVERWYGLISQKNIRCGSFSKVKKLTRSINVFLKQYNAQALAWVATDESILAPPNGSEYMFSVQYTRRCRMKLLHLIMVGLLWLIPSTSTPQNFFETLLEEIESVVEEVESVTEEIQDELLGHESEEEHLRQELGG